VAVAVGAIVVGTSTAEKAGKPTYRYYSGMTIVFDTGVVRVFVENPTTKDQKTTVSFYGIGAPKDVPLTVGADDVDSAASNVCGSAAGCNAFTRVKTKSGALVPTARYIEASSSAGTGIDNHFSYVRPGDFIVTRDGKRAW
jgi:hypothetical protein